MQVLRKVTLCKFLHKVRKSSWQECSSKTAWSEVCCSGGYLYLFVFQFRQLQY